MNGTTLTDRLGRCYELAGKTLCGWDGWTAAEGKENAVLIHGRILSRNPQLGLIGHAWVEYDDALLLDSGVPYRTRMAHDPVMGDTLPVRAYRAIVSAEVEIEYTLHEAMVLMAETEHYGPWHDGPIERGEQ